MPDSDYEQDRAAYYSSDPDPEPIRANRDQAHEPVRDSVLAWWENKMAQRENRAALAELLRDDQSSFPEGHPCRDCDRLYREHPTQKCEAWR